MYFQCKSCARTMDNQFKDRVNSILCYMCAGEEKRKQRRAEREKNADILFKWLEDEKTKDDRSSGKKRRG